MKFKRTIAPFQLTNSAMAVFTGYYAPGAVTEKDPQAVRNHNLKQVWKLKAQAEKGSKK